MPWATLTDLMVPSEKSYRMSFRILHWNEGEKESIYPSLPVYLSLVMITLHASSCTWVWRACFCRHPMPQAGSEKGKVPLYCSQEKLVDTCSELVPAQHLEQEVKLKGFKMMHERLLNIASPSVLSIWVNDISLFFFSLTFYIKSFKTSYCFYLQSTSRI